MTGNDYSMRRSQLITPFGVGAIYQVSGESFVACDTSEWTGGERIELTRLSDDLNVDYFKQGPSGGGFGNPNSDAGVPFMRFPEWQFCESCRIMTRLNMLEARKKPKCYQCNSPLTPMRWIAACKDGHLQDLDWWWWAHSGAQGDRSCVAKHEKLKFVINPEAGGGLASQVIQAECGASRSLQGITGPHSLSSVGISCNGIQPWEYTWLECEKAPQALLKGASNVHYPQVATALDIPPKSNAVSRVDPDSAIKNHDFFNNVIDGGFDNEGNPIGIGQQYCEIISENTGTPLEKVIEVCFLEWNQDSAISPNSEKVDLAYGEFLAFLAHHRDQSADDNFITEHTTLGAVKSEFDSELLSKASEIIESVVLAKRLREVRALRGFTRVQPNGSDPEITLVKPDLGKGENWLPATENFGEGVFLNFNEGFIANWEKSHAVTERAMETQRLAANLNASWLPEATPRFVALHTLSHALIRQLTFECGYSSSALRERIYCRTSEEGEAMAGILIYTSAGDSQGSLGGLVRQGESPRLLLTILAALESISWCSSDPVCSELRAGYGGLNFGACHACALISETSCTNSNILLDRTLVTGENGLMRPIIDLAQFT